MTISEALREGNNHITCIDDTEFDVRPTNDGKGYIIHHIERAGKPLAKNRLKMETKDAETWVKRKHGGIKEIGPGKYDQYVPENNDQVDDDDLEEIPGTAPVNDINFEEDEPAVPQQPQLMPQDYNPNPRPTAPPSVSDFLNNSPMYQQALAHQQMAQPMTQPIPQPMYQPQPIPTPQPSVQRSSVIFEDMAMTGDIDTQGSVEVYGSITGNIKAAGGITITGCVDGDVTAGDIAITGNNAEVIGNVTGDQVVIQNGCTVVGNINAGDLTIEGAVKGNIDAAGTLKIRASAIIKGDIMTKVLVVEEGAVVDGSCRQGYAERTPDSYFQSYLIKMTGAPLEPDSYQEPPKSVIKKDRPTNPASNQPAPAPTPAPQQVCATPNISFNQMING